VSIYDCFKKNKVVELKAEVKEIEAFIIKFEALKPQN